jgi:uncharacterized protein (DUF58 family)
MDRSRLMQARRVGATLTGSGVLAAILHAGWVGAIVLIAAVTVLVGALCWVLADSDRSVRLTRVLAAWRTTAAPQRHGSARVVRSPRYRSSSPSRGEMDHRRS